MQDLNKITIDGRELDIPKGKSILEASLDSGIYIPHLCHHPDLPPVGACRLCIVEIEGRGIMTSCTTDAEDGMKIITKNEEIDKRRRLAMELMLAGHPPDCGTCIKYLNCELQSLKQYLVEDHLRVRTRAKLLPVKSDNPLFIHDPNKCVLCGRCVRACRELRGIGVLFYNKNGKESYTGTASDLPLNESGCRFCGACAEVCPTGAIMDKEEYAKGKRKKEAIIPCRYNCPAEIDAPRYLRFIREKNYSAAVAVIREKAPFPGVLGYICGNPCESACRRNEINQAVSIRNLKRYAVKNDVEHIWKNNNKKPSTGKKVAVIGSGPAGLTAAYYLSKQGHEATIFESMPGPGGMMRFGIPEYRLPKELLDAEIRYITDTGVKIHTNRKIESIDELLEQGYDAIIIAVGTQTGKRLPVPGADSPDILIGLEFLKAVNAGKNPAIGNKVLVLGGGNVAFDCARTARRIGAEEVCIACLECRADMPAADDEIGQGEEEGIAVYPSKTFTRILKKDGKTSGVETMDVESVCFDDNNNPEIETVPGSHLKIEADTVIFAVGQGPDIPSGFDIDLTERGFIALDSYTFTTSREEVFAAGDAVNGKGSVIEAIASGRKAAISADKYLGGDGKIDEKLAPDMKINPFFGSNPSFASMKRSGEICLMPEERIGSFCSVTADMDDETADYEAKRCLQCDSRLAITPVKFWGNF